MVNLYKEEELAVKQYEERLEKKINFIKNNYKELHASIRVHRINSPSEPNRMVTTIVGWYLENDKYTIYETIDEAVNAAIHRNS